MHRCGRSWGLPAALLEVLVTPALVLQHLVLGSSLSQAPTKLLMMALLGKYNYLAAKVPSRDHRSYRILYCLPEHLLCRPVRGSCDRLMIQDASAPANELMILSQSSLNERAFASRDANILA